ncbi:TrlF family AAA-like ATPase [Shewanella surugensis]|uniref:ABC transporter n=1 Tax=Shewanella surugensis TaxID=212020 RepID=A0ABT0L6U8_9GAMM|nr:ABC transporter [Shewanella surugensis]MCL1123419.1 ABC transporter [Shewanella surugensis]
MTDKKYPRGSEWRKWDLHIHTPASFHWSGKRFNADPKSLDNADLVDEMIDALNSAEPAVFAFMDYWTFDGWFALKHRLSQPGAPELTKTVFPGIELRLVAPMTGRLNAHVLFSDTIEDQYLRDFKTALEIALINRPLSDHSLKCLARHVGDDLLNKKGYQRCEVNDDDSKALEAGSKIAEITCDSYKKAILNVPDNKAIGFMPFNTNDGLADIKWNEHYSYCLGLFDSSPIFETRLTDTWAAFVGIETKGNEKWISNFQLALKNIPRLAISGSDAHRFIGESGNKDRRGYGDYPSEKATWIKANPTFEGLQQAIKEPAKRSFIGEQPPKKKLFNENRSLFIDKLEINKSSDSTLNDEWLNQTRLDLNPDLIAIIGNKGSGKSALADITALLGNSKQSHHFSFLKENRFRGKTGEPAKHFVAKSTWADGKDLEKNLNENPATENVEFVKYIPQGHFEELCNAHVSGKSDAFEKELRAVIFSHADDTIRLGALDFDQLIEQQERSLRSRIDGLRNELHNVNQQIDSTESQMLPETRRAIEELLTQKLRLIDELNKIRPEDVAQPTSELTDEQQKATGLLAEIVEELEKTKAQKQINQDELTKLAAKKKAGRNLLEGIDVVNRTIQNFFTSFDEDAKLIGLDINEIIQLKINEQRIADVESETSTRETEIGSDNQKLEEHDQAIITKREPLNAKLNYPQQAYQNYLDQLNEWEEKKISILGSRDLPDTLKGLEHRKEQLDSLPTQRSNLQADRLEKTAQIFDLLNEQRANRETLFQPVQQLIQNNSLIRDEYKLQFKAELSSTTELITDKLFSLVKQASGEFRGESESLAAIKELTDRHDLNNRQSLLGFLTELHDKLEGSSSGQIGIQSMLRKGRSANEVYDFLFDLEYLKPRYTLMFQDAHIEQLSPGQRGSLLLIFYLLVDKGNTPIILDQPEENLDNETIVSLLVPVLNEAKQKR